MKASVSLNALSAIVITVSLITSQAQVLPHKQSIYETSLDYHELSTISQLGYLEDDNVKRAEIEAYLANLPAIDVAIRNGQTELVTALLDSGADVNCIDGCLLTPLFWAVMESHPDIVDLLIARGARVDNLGFSLLCIAAVLGHPEIVNELLLSGATANEILIDRQQQRDDNFQNALEIIRAKVDCINQFMLYKPELLNSEYIPYQRIRPRIRLCEELTALHHAAMNGNAVVINLLLDAGADPNAFNSWDGTPLCLAASFGNYAAVCALLDAGANPDTSRSGGATPLHMAAAQDYEDIVKALLDAGANVNTRNQVTWSPLHDAAFDGQTAIVKLLLEAGADPRAQDEDGLTPRDWAMTERSRAYPRPKSCDDCAELLKRHGG